MAWKLGFILIGTELHFPVTLDAGQRQDSRGARVAGRAVGKLFSGPSER